MKALRLALLITCSALFTACETDVPSDPSTPAVSFGNNQFRDSGRENPATPAIDDEKTPW